MLAAALGAASRMNVGVYLLRPLVLRKGGNLSAAACLLWLQQQHVACKVLHCKRRVGGASELPMWV